MATSRAAWMLCILALLCSQSHAMSDEIRLAGELKLNEMIEKSAAANGYIDIQGSDFEKFISRGPRPYFCLVILTALSSGNCQPCEQLNPEIESLAKIIEDQRNKISDSEHALYSDSDSV